MNFHMFICFILDIDECVPEPCQNNGTCTDQINAYECQCIPGFNGTNCENGKSQCHMDWKHVYYDAANMI
jgi:hypothetical protein